ncbi:hypothetical protein FQN54_002865 [Arachnomyces sp. PD_36]|nr:hypothetical protein FQN54_002865 [Arachnomyces sp. PD_36]
MCIALISTAHPSYPLILIDNRDEFLRRPTAPADWWSEPSSHVLGSRDLARSVQGTWLGVTKQGRIAVLTNYREDSSRAVGLLSRGSIVNSFLELPPDSQETTQSFVEGLVSDGSAQDAGGFSLVCGEVGEPLAVMSNRVSSAEGITWLAKGKGETVGLSNTAFGDRSWPKIVKGEELMMEAINTSHEAGESEDELIHRLLDLLSTDTLPKAEEGAGMATYINLLRHSIFIPALGEKEEEKRAADELAASKLKEKIDVIPGEQVDQTTYMSGLYGTQKQTVVLFDFNGRIRFFERTLYDDNAEVVPIGEGDRSFDFTVER